MLKGNRDIALYNGLPKGCELCRLGGKLVVFITGECGDSCYYCPVSEGRFSKDVAYANERKVTSVMDFVYEAYKMNALGAGITGGDPILRIDRVVEVTRVLKDEFGKEFHVHLYTSGRYVTHDVLRELERSGVDEIRFHPVNREYLRAVEKALGYSFEVGIEVPSIPGNEQELEEIIKWAELHGVKFVNINELEITERNALALNAKGLRVSHGLAGARGSAETAIKVVEKFQESKVLVHYCSSVYKDVVETRTRFLRTLRYTAKPFERYTGEGTVVRAIVKTNANLEEFGEKVEEGYAVSDEVVEEIIKSFPVDEVRIVEELPYGLRISERSLYPKPKDSH
ncbi:MAG: radical SAM protein [Candidatus Aramenus sp.]|jgi:pyruvate formate-lyase activating enzyme-like uncharacterized protein|nr:radical SAM protein [Candidatus Aramenus sp.]